MKKLTKLLILSLSALTCFSACGNPSSSEPSSQQPSSEQPSSEPSSEVAVDKDALLSDAADFLWQTYKDVNRSEVISNVALQTQVLIGGYKVDVAWAHEVKEGTPGEGIKMGTGELIIDYFGELITNKTQTFKVALTPTLSYDGVSKGLGDALGKPERNVITFDVPPIEVGNHADWVKLAKDNKSRIALEGTIVDMIDPSSSSGSKGSFYMIDDEGHGYYVYGPTHPKAGPAKSGDRVLVSGTRSDYSGQEEFARGAAYGVLSSGHAADIKFKNATADWASAGSTSSSDPAFATRFESKVLGHADLGVTSTGDAKEIEVETTNASYSSKPKATISTKGVYQYTKSGTTYFSFHQAKAATETTEAVKDTIKVTAPAGYTIGSVELVTSGTFDNLDWYVDGKKITEATKKVAGNLVSTGVVNASEVAIENASKYYVNGISLKVNLVDATINYQNNVVELNGCVPQRISGTYYYFTVGEGTAEYNIYDTYYFLSDTQREAFTAAWNAAWNAGKTLTVKGISTVYSSKYQVYGSTLAPEIITVDGELTAEEKHAYVEKLLKSSIAEAYKEDATIALPTLPEYATVAYELTSPTEGATVKLETKEGVTSIKVERSQKETTNVIKASVTIGGETKVVELKVNTKQKLPLEYFLTGEVAFSKVTPGTAAAVEATNESGEKVNVSVLASEGMVDSSGDYKIAAGQSILVTAPEGYVLDTVEVDSNGNYNTLDFFADAEQKVQFDDNTLADSADPYSNQYRTDNDGRTLTTIPVNGATFVIANNSAESYNVYSHWFKVTLKKVTTGGDTPVVQKHSLTPSNFLADSKGAYVYDATTKTIGDMTYEFIQMANYAEDGIRMRVKDGTNAYLATKTAIESGIKSVSFSILDSKKTYNNTAYMKFEFSNNADFSDAETKVLDTTQGTYDYTITPSVATYKYVRITYTFTAGTCYMDEIAINY